MKVTIRPLVLAAKRGGPALPHSVDAGERIDGLAKGNEDGRAGDG